jgi:lipid-A-disaccharide synthase-like uncharacterized protein
MKRRTLIGIVGATALLVVVTGAAVMSDAGDEAINTTRIKVRMAGADQKVDVIEKPGGKYEFALKRATGDQTFSPDDFARFIVTQSRQRTWWHELLNISGTAGLAWVALGLLGQVLFTGRMVVQWLISEKHRQSIVPVSFWWMSVGGATMLLTYFVWRQDIVGVLGQSTGWFIYVRNLYFIYKRRGQEKQDQEKVEAEAGNL